MLLEIQNQKKKNNMMLIIQLLTQQLKYQGFIYFFSYLLLFNRKRRQFPPEVAEEHARIGREYNRQMFIQHNQHVKDMTLKIYLRQDAMKALPPDLYKLASVIDETPPPRNRPYPIWYTPPVPGLLLTDPDGEENEEQTMALEKGHYITDMFSTDSNKYVPDGPGGDGDSDDSGSEAEY